MGSNVCLPEPSGGRTTYRVFYQLTLVTFQGEYIIEADLIAYQSPDNQRHVIKKELIGFIDYVDFLGLSEDIVNPIDAIYIPTSDGNNNIVVMKPEHPCMVLSMKWRNGKWFVLFVASSLEMPHTDSDPITRYIRFAILLEQFIPDQRTRQQFTDLFINLLRANVDYNASTGYILQLAPSNRTLEAITEYMIVLHGEKYNLIPFLEKVSSKSREKSGNTNQEREHMSPVYPPRKSNIAPMDDELDNLLTQMIDGDGLQRSEQSSLASSLGERSTDVDDSASTANSRKRKELNMMERLYPETPAPVPFTTTKTDRYRVERKIGSSFHVK